MIDAGEEGAEEEGEACTGECNGEEKEDANAGSEHAFSGEGDEA